MVPSISFDSIGVIDILLRKLSFRKILGFLEFLIVSFLLIVIYSLFLDFFGFFKILKLVPLDLLILLNIVLFFLLHFYFEKHDTSWKNISEKIAIYYDTIRFYKFQDDSEEKRYFKDLNYFKINKILVVIINSLFLGLFIIMIYLFYLKLSNCFIFLLFILLLLFEMYLYSFYHEIAPHSIILKTRDGSLYQGLLLNDSDDFIELVEQILEKDKGFNRLYLSITKIPNKDILYIKKRFIPLIYNSSNNSDPK